VLDHLLTIILPTLNTEVSTVGAAGYDMTESFLTTLREFVLGEAQECFWQQAVLREVNYTHCENSADGQRALTRTG